MAAAELAFPNTFHLRGLRKSMTALPGVVFIPGPLDASHKDPFFGAANVARTCALARVSHIARPPVPC
eukprot:2265092-Lingulodinium_polyedra.AAC.1